MKSFEASLQELNSAQDGASIESALENVTTLSEGTAQSKQKLLKKLDNMLQNASVPINAKIRRKVKRLHESLSENKTNQSSAEVSEEPAAKKQKVTEPNEVVQQAKKKPKVPLRIPKIVPHPPQFEEIKNDVIVVEVDIAAVIDIVTKSKTATDVETALIPIKSSEIGTKESRNALKEAIEATLSRSEIESTINARVRRRVNRVFKFIEEGNEVKPEPQLAPSQPQTGNPTPKRSTVVPYIVFVGQLSFDATGDEVEAFLRSKGVQGSIKVRLLTNPQTKESKGMGFIEFDEAAEMHKCIALHHSIFKGRKINLEKSCGGKNKERRKTIIAGKKTEQTSKLTETVQRILQDYEGQGVIQPGNFGESFKTKVVTVGPHVLSKVSYTSIH